ncbi:hypothetical protein SDC9_169382 [bioreactor metagenome]|uniref:Uncharacterized protein n=1 Tax=bioreactor metagenome TaxID=1076179 RepID=A0A645G882_9ZZZZ
MLVVGKCAFQFDQRIVKGGFPPDGSIVLMTQGCFPGLQIIDLILQIRQIRSNFPFQLTPHQFQFALVISQLPEETFRALPQNILLIQFCFKRQEFLPAQVQLLQPLVELCLKLSCLSVQAKNLFLHGLSGGFQPGHRFR